MSRSSSLRRKSSRLRGIATSKKKDPKFAEVEKLVLEKYKSSDAEKVRVDKAGNVTAIVTVQRRQGLKVLSGRVRYWVGSFGQLLSEALSKQTKKGEL